ncbi:MAG TPA: hypothetical protein VNB90_15855 [Cytophagaceae bacterium]|nr:hypothetical protein [Cytophagaceae bacterium]
MKQRNAENRNLEKMPVFSLNKTRQAKNVLDGILGIYKDVMIYKNKFHTYYEDRFVLKYILFENYKTIQRGVFAQQPIPQKVVEGTDGWMFLGNSYSNDIAESKGIKVFTEKEIIKIKTNLLNQKEWLDKKGIHYYVAIAPNKLSVYGEYLAIKRSEKKTKREQLIEAMNTTALPLIDMTALLRKTDDTILYEKTGSHWNDLGAFYGYKTLINRIHKDYPEIVPLELKDFNRIPKITYQEDLIKMLNESRLEKQISLTAKYPEASKQVASQLSISPYYNKLPQDYEKRYKSNVNRLKVVMFRDSFSSAMLKYVKENFGEVVFVWSDRFDKELIETEKPDIVIQEVVEREVDVFLRE